jgi:hypothetical protein
MRCSTRDFLATKRSKVTKKSKIYDPKLRALRALRVSSTGASKASEQNRRQTGLVSLRFCRLQHGATDQLPAFRLEVQAELSG